MGFGYILKLDDWVKSFNVIGDSWGKYLPQGEKLKNKIQEISYKTIQRFIKANGHLDAEGIMDELFSEVKADVFLSHSHKDNQYVTAFAGYLKSIGAEPFVDSFVWSNVDDLLNTVNNKYSRTLDGDYDYDYSKVKYYAAQVYAMLNSSLFNMMRRTNRYILLESAHSVHSNKTTSPWIYSEILYSQVLFTEKETLGHSEEHIIFSESVKFDYPAYTGHLTPLQVNSIYPIFSKRKEIYG